MRQQLKGLEEKISEIRLWRSHEGGGEEAKSLTRTTHRWALGIGVTVVLALLAAAVRVILKGP